MNALDRIMNKERKKRYKRLSTLFIARDMASKYVKQTIKVSDLDRHFDVHEHKAYFIGDLAKYIVDHHQRILGIHSRPPRPVRKKK